MRLLDPLLFQLLHVQGSLDKVNYFWIPELTDIVCDFLGDTFSRQRVYHGATLLLLP